MNETSLNYKRKEITELENRLKLRQTQFKNVKSDLESKSAEVKDIQESLDTE